MIRHCVEETNVDDDMNVIDPTRMRHVTIAAGKVELISGLVDPASHLNLDFPDHRATACIIAERFEVGAKVKMDNDGLAFATVSSSLYGHYGYLDYTQRLVDMIKAIKTKNQGTKKASKRAGGSSSRRSRSRSSSISSSSSRSKIKKEA